MQTYVLRPKTLLLLTAHVEHATTAPAYLTSQVILKNIMITMTYYKKLKRKRKNQYICVALFVVWFVLLCASSFHTYIYIYIDIQFLCMVCVIGCCVCMCVIEFVLLSLYCFFVVSLYCCYVRFMFCLSCVKVLLLIVLCASVWLLLLYIYIYIHMCVLLLFV